MRILKFLFKSVVCDIGSQAVYIQKDVPPKINKRFSLSLAISRFNIIETLKLWPSPSHNKWDINLCSNVCHIVRMWNYSCY